MRRLQTLFQLAGNDIKSKYANSLLGITWAFAMPLATILVFWYVFQMGFRNPPIENAPYILWFSAAYIPWIFFSDVTTSGCNSLVEYSFLVKKIRFNVRYIPVVKLLSALFVHCFFILFLMGMYLFYGYDLQLYNIQLLYYTFCTSVLGLGLTWLLSAITVFFKDLNSLYSIIIQIGFWVTPILWNEDTMQVERVRRILAVNPMHYVVNGYRQALFEQQWFWENPYETVGFWAITALICIVGRFVFLKLEPFFSDEV